MRGRLPRRSLAVQVGFGVSSVAAHMLQGFATTPTGCGRPLVFLVLGLGFLMITRL